LSEKVVFINRSAKVVKGGRRFSFSALVVAGDKHGRIGLGLGKAVEVSEAIRKGGEMAKQRMITVALKDATIPHAVFCRYGGAKVMLRPASPGTGIIAGPKVRAVLEAAGIKDILSKSLGSNNPSNVVKATMEGLERLRTREVIYRGRGMEVKPKKAAVVVPAPLPARAPTAALPAPAPVATLPAPVPVPALPAPVPAPPAPVQDVPPAAQDVPPPATA
jgi:small subunit ribosomal protein S5